MERLKKLLSDIHQKGYKSYKQIKGDYAFPGFIFRIDHVQGDPFADPSNCRLFISTSSKTLPDHLFNNSDRKRALEDFIGRQFAAAIKARVQGKRGSGRSGEISIVHYGQEVLKRNAVLVSKGCIEVRIRVALPANLRSVDGIQAQEMCLKELPSVVRQATALVLQTDKEERVELSNFVKSVENQSYLRAQLAEKKLVSFIADGSILPRQSGVDEAPLPNAIKFESPKTMSVELTQLNGKKNRGMGVSQGVTLIVGGGFHGKSTLLHALERGVYDYIPGDGREGVVTIANACKIRAEDRRAVTGVDISAFVDNLPQGKDTHCFSTQDASGSTSQASNIIEALETQTELLLIDEDTSAANFMIRDQRMRALVTKDKEPITPLISSIQDMVKQTGVSVVIVMGGSSDFFAVADKVIMMDNYVAKDVSEDARNLANEASLDRQAFRIDKESKQRVIDASCLSPLDSNRKEKIQAFDARFLRYGQSEIDVSKLEQLADNAQLLSIGYLIQKYYDEYPFASRSSSLIDDLKYLLRAAEEQGLDSLPPYIMGVLAMPRLQELAAVINRMRNLKVN